MTASPMASRAGQVCCAAAGVRREMALDRMVPLDEGGLSSLNTVHITCEHGRAYPQCKARSQTA